MPRRRCLAFALLAIVATGSSHGGAGCLDTLFHDRFEDISQNRYEVELVVSLLGSRSASFQLNGGETITANGDGTYCFAEQVQGGQPYEVAITEQPATGDPCEGDLTGIATAPVSIAISCGPDRAEWDRFDWDQANWN